MQVDYERLSRALAGADIENSAAEVHGVLCGLLGGMADAEEQARGRWLDELLEPERRNEPLVRDCLRLLEGLWAETLNRLTGENPGYRLLLPDDEKPLRQRGEAVRDWSQGFLYGIGLSGLERRRLSKDAQEALRDLGEFARMEVEGLGKGSEAEIEEEEESLMQVVEFLWVAATFLREELRSSGPGLGGRRA